MLMKVRFISMEWGTDTAFINYDVKHKEHYTTQLLIFRSSSVSGTQHYA